MTNSANTVSANISLNSDVAEEVTNARHLGVTLCK